MKTEDLKTRFAELYEQMATSKNVSNMKLFGSAFKNMYAQVAVALPDVAFATLEALSAIEYHNYVSASEAQTVATSFINDDRVIMSADQESKGAHWTADEVKAILSSRGILLEDKPYYNWWALWLTINMIYSDDADTLSDLLGTKDQEQLAVACYKLALRKLKDPDRPYFVRDYFHLDK